jgi:hypothetical protein
MRVVRWAIPAAALGVASLGMAASADIEDAWCAPQISGAGARRSGDALVAIGGEFFLAASSVFGAGRSLLRRRT